MGWTGFSRSSRTVCTGGGQSRTQDTTFTPKPRIPSSASTPLSLPSAHLQFPQGIVTLLLAWSLLGAHGDELVNAVGHRPGRNRRLSGCMQRSSFLDGKCLFLFRV